VKNSGKSKRRISVNHYELMVIFSPTLNDEEQRQQSAHVEELLKHENAVIHLTDHWGKRKLAYPVKKQRQGFYDWYYFELDPSRISEIDRKLKMSETILRFMSLKMEKIQIQNLKREVQRRIDAVQAQPVPEPAAEPSAAMSETMPDPQEAQAEGTPVVENAPVANESTTDEQGQEG
jgi:small subunit ribosomal protein S6